MNVDSEAAVLVVAQPSNVWGAQLRLLALAQPLADRGTRLTLAGAADSRFAMAWAAKGLPLLRLELAQHEGLRRPDDPAARATLAQLLRAAVWSVRDAARIARAARRFDAIVSYSLKTHVAAVLGGRLARRPVVLEVVDLVAPGIGRRLLRGAASLATTTIVNSSATAAMFTDTGATVTVPPGVDVQLFSPAPADPALRGILARSPGDPVVGIVGRLDPEKGIEVVAHAVRELQDRGIPAQLAVVGDRGVTSPSYADELRRRVGALLGDNVRFTGRLDDVASVMRTLDVLVNASQAEPFGLSILEAQASGTPVIATESGGAIDLVQHELTGLLVPPSDPRALADAIERLLTEEGLRRRLVDAARARAVESFGLAQQHDLMARLYRGSGRS